VFGLALCILLAIPVASLAAETYTRGDSFGGSALDNPIDAAVGRGGRIYVPDPGNHRVVVFDDSGAVVDTWGKSGGGAGSGEGEFTNPRGVCVDRVGRVWVADTGNDRIQRFDWDGDFVSEFGESGTDYLDFDEPHDVAVAWDGTVWVSDYQNNRVQRIARFGGEQIIGKDVGGVPVPSSAEGGFDGPMGIDVDKDGNVYVADSQNHRVQKFDSEGAFVDAWGKKTGGFPDSGSGDGEFLIANNAQVDPRGDVFATDLGNTRVQKLDSDGTYLTEFDGFLSQPTGAAPDLYRGVYAVDNGPDTLTRYHAPVASTSMELSGQTRYETAIEISKETAPDGSIRVIVATGQDYPDALTASSLAGVFGDPVLLTLPDQLPPAVRDEIVRLGPSQVLVVGGTGVVSQAVEDQLAAIPGVNGVTRLAGADRYETALKVMSYLISDTDEGQMLRHLQPGRPIFIATGENFPDALAAAPLATNLQAPIMLCTAQHGLLRTWRASLQSFMWVDEVVLLGGPDVVPPLVEQQVKEELPNVQITRLEGPTRYETAIAIAEYGMDERDMDWAQMGFATGLNFPDALTGGVLQGTDSTTMLLVAGDTLSTTVADALSDRKDAVYDVRYFGGVDVLGQNARDGIENLLY
jgi:putative cell wall-binding protein/sugar lactone lactonase YvrE